MIGEMGQKMKNTRYWGLFLGLLLPLQTFAASPSACIEQDDIILAIADTSPPDYPIQNGRNFKLSSFDRHGNFKRELFRSPVRGSTPQNHRAIEALAWNRQTGELMVALHGLGIQALDPKNCSVRPFIQSKEIMPDPETGSAVYVDTLSQTSTGEILIIPGHTDDGHMTLYSWKLLAFDPTGSWARDYFGGLSKWRISGLSHPFSDPVGFDPQYLFCDDREISISSGQARRDSRKDFARRDLYGWGTYCRQLNDGSVVVNVSPANHQPESEKAGQLIRYSKDLQQILWSVPVSQMSAYQLYDQIGDIAETHDGSLLVSSHWTSPAPFSIITWNSNGNFARKLSTPQMNGAYLMVVAP
jgi:hypothetical protein